jgi:hypothetical protein
MSNPIRSPHSAHRRERRTKKFQRRRNNFGAQARSHAAPASSLASGTTSAM